MQMPNTSHQHADVTQVKRAHGCHMDIRYKCIPHNCGELMHVVPMT